MKKKAIILVILVLALLIGLNSFYTVREDQYAARVQFSKIIEITDQAGIHF